MKYSDIVLRIKVAELLGYRWKLNKEGTGYSWHDPSGIYIHRRLFRDDATISKGEEASYLPDYPNDLNACYEMEQSLSGDRFYHYCVVLAQICLDEKHLHVVSATARQRCKAFVRTMEKR